MHRLAKVFEADRTRFNVRRGVDGPRASSRECRSNRCGRPRTETLPPQPEMAELAVETTETESGHPGGAARAADRHWVQNMIMPGTQVVPPRRQTSACHPSAGR